MDNRISNKHKEIFERMVKAHEIKARTPESKIGKMVEYLKQLDKDERIFRAGNSPSAFVGATLISITQEGITHHSNLSDDHFVSSIGPLTDAGIEEIKNSEYLDDIDEIMTVIALRKKQDLRKEIYYPHIFYYSEMTMEEIENDVEFYDTYADAFQRLGEDVKSYDNIETWDELWDSDIEECYSKAVKYKTGKRSD